MGRARWYEIALVPLCLLLIVNLGLTQNCGQRKVVNFLIVNGSEAKDGHWPWHAAIFHKTALTFDYVCGGTILNQNTILTAAHCVMTFEGIIQPESLVVHLGRHRLRIATMRTQQHEVLELIVHPEYNSNGVRHNIALVELATDITYTDYIQPVCLWNRGEDQKTIVGSWGTVVGFGIDETDTPSDTLREATIPVVSPITCIESDPVYASVLTSDMFCAGNANGISACNQDSGGGIFFKYNDVWYIRGVVSFTRPRQGTLICDPNVYTVFTDVAKYLKWIEQPVGLKRLTA
ncbi:enteropeptidase-like [Anopheles moucheti]|uniref:enteropeptidase-like n=1 Tax=Anopheles moucheti TaxID=186751 RepID=UPI0022F00ECB|nr:enteropeptidase-like [Anopheles moucheti]